MFLSPESRSFSPDLIVQTLADQQTDLLTGLTRFRRLFLSDGGIITLVPI
jgi:hypothetical protein